MSKEKLNIEVDIEIEEAIYKLNLIKQLLTDIKELDNNFNLSNVLEVNKDSILIFNCKRLMHNKDIETLEDKLKEKLKYNCIVLPFDIELEKIVNKKKCLYNTKTEEISPPI